MNSHTGFLVVIAVVLIGILGIFIYQAQEPDTVGEQISESVENAGDEMGDAIDDAADNAN